MNKELQLVVKDKGRRSGYIRSLIGSSYLHDTIGVDLESDFDLGNTTWCGRDGRELEFTQEVVVLSQRTFTLEDLDENGGLIVGGGGEAS